MSGNQQKTPLTTSLNRFAEAKNADASQLDGKSLPCSVVKVVSSGIVTVKFEIQSSALGATLPNVTMPIFGPEYVRYPTQVGDKGFVVAADAYLGGVSGLGGGVAGLVQQGNLATLVFLPIGNTAWVMTPNANAVIIYGSQGGGVTLLSDITGQVVKLILSSSGVHIVGNVILDGNLTINGAATTTGNVTAGQGTGGSVELLNHAHLNGGGKGNSGPPVPGS